METTAPEGHRTLRERLLDLVRTGGLNLADELDWQQRAALAQQLDCKPRSLGVIVSRLRRELDYGKPTRRRGDWMPTSTGVVFWPLDPRPDEVRLPDIANALSQTPRFGGHLPRFFSVAEHSVLVAAQCCGLAGERRPAVPGIGAHVSYERRVGLVGLFHDASEAYLGDLIRPLKRQGMFAPYREAEERLQACIWQALGLADDAEEHADLVKLADEQVLWTEIRQLVPWYERDFAHRWQSTTQPLPVELTCLSPEAARQLFLHTFSVLAEDNITHARRDRLCAPTS